MEIYADNFRGFKNQTIKIDDVSFFVGENSTGKSSILSAITILDSLENSHFPKFSNGFGDMNFYSDIASNNDPFKLGLSTGSGNKKEIFIYQFNNIDGKPSLFSFLFYASGHIGYADTIGYGIKGPEVKDYSKEEPPTFDAIEEHRIALAKKYHEQADHVEDSEERKERSTRANFFPFVFGTKMEFSEDFLPKGENRYEFSFSKNFKELVWLAPIRTEAKRIYEDIETQFSPTGEHTPGMIKSLIENKKSKDLINKLKEFGKFSQLYDSIEIKSYGKEKDSPFQIMLKMGGNKVRITNTGYGVSQVLPIVLEVISRKDPTIFILMQPEVHLHPKAQAALGELIANITLKTNKKFIIETHSDYLINRYRLTINRAKKSTSSSVSFFSRGEDCNKAVLINIQENGQYDSSQPKEFRDFFIQEELNLLEI